MKKKQYVSPIITVEMLESEGLLKNSNLTVDGDPQAPDGEKPETPGGTTPEENEDPPISANSLLWPDF